MALSKKTKTVLKWVAFAALLFFGPRIISEIRLRGTWNGIPWSTLKKDYPMRLSMFGFGNGVAVVGRSDLKGTLAGDVISWSNGTAFKRG